MIRSLSLYLVETPKSPLHRARVENEIAGQPKNVSNLEDIYRTASRAGHRSPRVIDFPTNV